MAKLIVFEGLDNLGKTTQINLLKKVLPQDKFTFTSCPGGSEVASQIRAVLADKAAREVMAKETETLLYAASHADVSHRIIAPAISTGKHVICDRYIHSALAYQGGLKGVPEETLMYLHEKFSYNLQPDIIFYFLGEPYKNTSEDNPGGYDALPQEKQKIISSVYNRHFRDGGLFKGKVIYISTRNRSEHDIHCEILARLHNLGIFSFSKPNISLEDLTSVKNRYAEMIASEKKDDEETFAASFVMLIATLNPYWDNLNFTFGKENLAPLFGLIKFTAEEFRRIPRKMNATPAERMADAKKTISILLENSGIDV